MENIKTKTLYTDGSFNWKHGRDTTENVVRGKICVTDGQHFTKIENVAIGKIEGLMQYINILEFFAIARAIELAIENDFHAEGTLYIFSDSTTAVAWAEKGFIKQGIQTEAHRNVLSYFLKQLKIYEEKYGGRVEFHHIPRSGNPAGYRIEAKNE